MRIRMMVGLSGPAINLMPGDEADTEQAEALRHIAAGNAVPVSEQKIERAVKAPRKAEKR